MKHAIALLLFFLGVAMPSLFTQLFSSPELVAPHLKSPVKLIVADLNGDGYADVVASGTDEFGWFRNLDGSGQYSGYVPIQHSGIHRATVVATDWDADGDLDLLVLGFTCAARLQYFENPDGTGAFSPGQTLIDFPALDLDCTRNFQVADIDNDGRMDIVTGSSSADRLHWFRRNETGFEPPVAIDYDGDQVTSYALGDVDLDGDLDLVTGHFAGAIPLVLRRFDTETASFLEREILPVPEDAKLKKVGLADFDGDGTPDLFQYDDESRLAVYLNPDSAGNFESFDLIFVPTEEYTTLTSSSAADVDGDGDRDILFVFEGAAWWLENTDGNGTFAAAPTALYATDTYYSEQQITAGNINPDDQLDFISLRETTINATVGTSEQTNLTAESFFYQRTGYGGWGMADFDGDGQVDLVGLIGGVGELQLYLDDGTVSAYYQPLVFATHLKNIHVGDVDQDGDPDIIGTNSEDNWVGWLENDALEFVPHQVNTDQFYPPGAYYLNSKDPAEPVDVDGDGDLDLLVYNTNEDHRVGWYENHGDGTFVGEMQLIHQLAEGSLRDVCYADFNGDGELDFALAAAAPDRLILAVYSASAGTYEIITRNKPYPLSILSAGDMDSDGDPDLLYYNPDERHVYWLDNNHPDLFFISANFVDQVLFANNFVGPTAEDFDQDGWNDVLFTSHFAGIAINNNAGTSFANAGLDIALGMDNGLAVAYDYDQDGDLDVVAGGQEGFYVALNENNVSFPRLTGTVYRDEDGDGQRDPAEPGLAGHRLFVDGNEWTAASEADGRYEFFVGVGNFDLTCVPVAGWALTTAEEVTVALSGSETDSVTVDFGLMPLANKTNEEAVEAFVLATYPNPASDRLWVTTSYPEPAVIRLLNAQGRVVGSALYMPGSRVELDVERLSAGNYQLEMIQNGRRVGGGHGIILID